jgi:cytochrome P450
MTTRRPSLIVDPATLEDDPYPAYEAVRDMGGVAWIEPLGMWWVTGHADVRAILGDPEHFAVGTDASLVRDIFGENMLTLDGKRHARLREQYHVMFAPAEVKRSLTPKIEAIANRLIDGFVGLEQVDLRPSYAARLPVLTMLALFGLDEGVESDVRRWYDAFGAALANFSGDPEVQAKGAAAAAEFRAYFGGGEEAASNALLIFFGGISTVEGLILNTLYAAATHGCPLGPHNVDRAIEETMRWLSPVQSATRHVVHARGPFEVGETVNCMIAAANRDPAVFSRPGQWDLTRSSGASHLGFASGPHFCLGNHLARLEARIAILCLHERLDSARLNPTFAGEAGCRIQGSEFRHPTHLWLGIVPAISAGMDSTCASKGTA